MAMVSKFEVSRHVQGARRMAVLSYDKVVSFTFLQQYNRIKSNKSEIFKSDTSHYLYIGVVHACVHL